jgi:hypothetical protein
MPWQVWLVIPGMIWLIVVVDEIDPNPADNSFLKYHDHRKDRRQARRPLTSGR